MIDEVNPGQCGNWSDSNLDYNNVDAILGMRYQYDTNKVDHIGTSFQMLPPSDKNLTLSHELVTRYRCGKEIQMISLFHEKHSSDAFKISGNHESPADIAKLPSGQVPLWYDRDPNVVPDKEILESMFTNLNPILEQNEGADIMVIYNKHKPNMETLIWLENKGCRCFNHIDMIGTEAFMVIVLDVEDFDVEMVTRSRNLLIFITNIK